MFGPGEYRPDPTEGITRIEDLPAPKILHRQRHAKRHLCPHCGHRAYRDKHKQRLLHDLGDLMTGRPNDIQITYAQSYCTSCRCGFTTDLTDLAPPNSAYTHRQGISPTEMRRVLQIEKDLGNTMQGMEKDGLLKRIAAGCYITGEEAE